MPAYIYRWPDGETSIVCVKNVSDACRILDELGDVENERVKRINHGEVMITLVPGEDGDFHHGEWGERMQATIMREYPLLSDLYRRSGGEPLREDLVSVIQQEKDRVSPIPEFQALKEQFQGELALYIESVTIKYAEAGVYEPLHGLWNLAGDQQIVLDHGEIAAKVKTELGEQVAARYQREVASYRGEDGE
jgi:hypothetical protein